MMTIDEHVARAPADLCFEVGAAVCGGIEAPLGPLSYGAFAIIRAMSTKNDDPERARTRGARIYAEVRGYGNTNDAHHMTVPRPDGAQAAVAMRRALETGGVRPEEVDYVNAYTSSTPLNDATESRAIQTVLDESASAIPVTGTKPYYSHVLGASGEIEVTISCLTLRHGWIPPTLNFERPGEG